MKYIFSFLALLAFSAAQAEPNETTYTVEELKQSPDKTKQLIQDMIAIHRFDLVERLFEIYQQTNDDHFFNLFVKAKILQFKNDYKQAILTLEEILKDAPDAIVVKLELARTLFLDRQNDKAKKLLEQLNKEDEKYNLFIEQYLDEIASQDKWQFNLNGYYVKEKNVNKASRTHYIEDTGFIKGEGLLPQEAKGLAYSFTANKIKNLYKNNYLYFSQDISGRYYFNNKKYNNLYQRVSLGYEYKDAMQHWKILPFYDLQWYGSYRYNKANGVRLTYQRAINATWKIYSAFEYGKLSYFRQPELDGHSRLLSSTLLWFINDNRYIYLSGDVLQERTRVKQYSYDFNKLGFGYYQKWHYDFVSDLKLSIGKKHFRDKLILGNIIPLNKARKDNIYTLDISLYKNNWNIYGIVPKIQMIWYKQRSNIKTMYSYTDMKFNILMEKSF